MRLDNLFNLFLLSLPFWIPAAIGLYLVANRRNELSLMAGLLTLKPILTTPLWLLIIISLQGTAVESFTPPLSILPGASLTVLAFLIFRRQFIGSRSAPARLLVVLDCLRWINSGLLTAAGSTYNAFAALACIFGLIGLLFPTGYAVVALTTTMATHEHEMAA